MKPEYRDDINKKIKDNKWKTRLELTCLWGIMGALLSLYATLAQMLIQ